MFIIHYHICPPVGTMEYHQILIQCELGRIRINSFTYLSNECLYPKESHKVSAIKYYISMSHSYKLLFNRNIAMYSIVLFIRQQAISTKMQATMRQIKLFSYFSMNKTRSPFRFCPLTSSTNPLNKPLPTAP